MTIPTTHELYDAGFFSGLDYHFARTIGRLGGETNSLVLLAAAAVSRFTRQGHVCLDLGSIVGTPLVMETGELLDEFRWPIMADWLAGLLKSPLVAQCNVSAPLVLDAGDRLYLARYWNYQQRLLEQLRQRSSREVVNVDGAVLARGLAQFFPGGDDPSNGQRLAAETSVMRHMTVVSGGPGTGKTTTVVKMLALMIDQALSRGTAPPRILLAAPTGKAAARLKASVAAAKALAAGETDFHVRELMAAIPEEAGTLHRLLGVGGREAYPASGWGDNLLPVDVLIVDEASMVDLSLMARLMAAVPEDARLILLGDKDQLASVDAGAILGDICRGASGPGEMEEKRIGIDVATVSGEKGADAQTSGIEKCIVNLTWSYRFDGGGGIGTLAEAIRRGDSGKALSCLEENRLPGVTFTAMPDVSALPGILKEISRKAYLPYFLEEDPPQKALLFNAFRILCAHRQGGAGVDTVNAIVERLLLAEAGMEPDRVWYPGRPVMVTRNDYQQNLFNGDVGLVVSSGGAPEELSVYFEETEGAGRMIRPSRLSSHDTVYAMTVHKSQGSEFDRVVLVLPPWRSPVVTRELLYTAVTRAKTNVTIIGTERVIREAVETPVQRASGLSEQLSKTPIVDMTARPHIS